MLHVDTFGTVAREEWEGFIRSHPLSGYGHLWEVRKLEELNGAETKTVVLRDAGGVLVGIQPLYLVKERALRLFPERSLMSGTFFPSGPLISQNLGRQRRHDALTMVMSATQEVAARSRADRVIMNYPFVVGHTPAVLEYRYYPLREFMYHETNAIGLLLDLEKDEKSLLAGMKGSCRSELHRCEDRGGAFHEFTHLDQWMHCHQLAVDTLDELAPSLEVFRTIWTDFFETGHVVGGFVEKDGEYASTAIAILKGSTSYYWFGFNSKPRSLSGANNLALWRVIQLCKARGARRFELGSLMFDKGKQTRISAFKASFGGEPYYSLSGALHRRRVKRLALEGLELGVSRFRSWRSGK